MSDTGLAISRMCEAMAMLGRDRESGVLNLGDVLPTIQDAAICSMQRHGVSVAWYRHDLTEKERMLSGQ